MFLVSLLLAFGSGCYVGANWESGSNAKKEVVVKDAVIKKADTTAKADVKAEAVAAPKKAETKAVNNAAHERIIHDTVTETVYVKPDCSITPDVMQQLGAAIANTNSAIRGTK